MRKLLVILLSLVLLLSTTACGRGTDDDGLFSITLSGQPSPHSLPIYIAMEKGWFEEAGLDVDVLIYITGPPQMEAVAGGAWCIGIAGIPATVAGVVGHDLTILAFSVWDHASHRIFVRPDSPIYTAGSGHFPGYPEIYGTPDLWTGIDVLATRGTVMHLNLLATLQAIGLTEDDVNIVNMEPPAAFQAFLAGEGDAITLQAAFTPQGVEEGWKEVSSAESADLFIPSAVSATETILAENPEVVQTVMNIIFRGLMWMNENRDEAAQILYDIMQQEGVIVTLDFARQVVEEHFAPPANEQEIMLEDGSFIAHLDNVMDYFLAAGMRTEEERQKVLASFDDTFLRGAIEYYKGLD